MKKQPYGVTKRLEIANSHLDDVACRTLWDDSFITDKTIDHVFIVDWILEVARLGVYANLSILLIRHSSSLHGLNLILT